MAISDIVLAAAAELTRTWNERPEVTRTEADGGRLVIDIAASTNSDIEGVTSYATLGLSDHSLGQPEARLELVAGFPTEFADAAHLMAACSFNAMEGRAPLYFGVIYPDILAHFRPNGALPHIMMMPPFLWEGGPNMLDLAEGKLVWMQLVPISEAERQLAKDQGEDALIALLEKAGVNVLDLDRPSVV